ncbi:unnamed protein product [Urochloa decumbens]|uniref:DUF4005 domain-containing protein n=1 Tax=Urochloa decumbens TaxID=240449 RepID=A0ABC8WM32_9POAL
MGKAARWFRSFLGKKDQPANKDQRPPPPPPPSAKRWSFGKSSRDSAEAAAAAAAGAGNAAIARAAEAAWLRSVAYAETDREREQSKHAIAVAAATAAAADAAVAAAQAAVAVVRLTSKGRPTPPVLASAAGGRAAAAVRIQTAFRGFLAKKALRALKALVKLQALVRGYLVRRQAAATLHSMQALVRAQATARARRAGAGVLPHLHHPPVRPRYSLQERYADDTRSEHGGAAAYGSRRLSASVESSSYGYDRSPKIVEVDPGRPNKSRSSSSRRASSTLTMLDAGGSSGGEDWCANSACSPLPCYLSGVGGPPHPPRIAVPTSRQFPDYDWCAPEKARPATAQSTPRYHHLHVNAPATPTKSVAAYSPSLHGGCPNYMSSTQASEAKSRSQSAPKQRPELAGGARKRVPLSEVVLVESSRASLSGVVGMQRGGCGSGTRAQEALFSFKSAVVGRIDRTLEVAGVENDRLAFLQRRW